MRVMTPWWRESSSLNILCCVIALRFVQVPIHAYHAYDAVMIYAKALTEALRDGHDPRNGTAIMERIRNRPYHSVLGFDVINNLDRPTNRNDVSADNMKLTTPSHLLFFFSFFPCGCAIRSLSTPTATRKVITPWFPCCPWRGPKETISLNHPAWWNWITSCSL